MAKFTLQLLTLALSSLRVVYSQGPPVDSNVLTWGFYGTHEYQHPTALDIEGKFPKWLSGSLYRGAAGTWDVGNYTAEHWFDGFSRNHKFDIANGRVEYRSRNATDELMDFVREYGRFPGGSFGGDPCKIIFGAFEMNYREGGNHTHGDKSSDNVGVTYVTDFAGLQRNGSHLGAPFETLVSTTDANHLQQIDPVTLEPIELFTYQANNPLISSDGRMGAHAAHGEDGSHFNYNLDMTTTPPTYRVFKVQAPTGYTSILANITDAPPAYIHSMFSTENYVILIVWQADLTQMAYNTVDSIGPWDPERKTLFYVVDKVKGGVVSKFVSEGQAFFAFHQVNSFENSTDGSIIVDLPIMNDTSFLNAAKIPSLRANLGDPGHSAQDLAGSFTRFRLPHATTAVSNGSFMTNTSSNGTLATLKAETVFSMDFRSSNIELPRINQAFSSKPYRYAYGGHVNKPGYFMDSIIKIDTKEQTYKTWTPKVNHVPSEPIFVAAPGATAEDDGVLLTVALDSSTRRSAVVVINATTMNELGRAKMPIVFGYGFHGVWGAKN